MKGRILIGLFISLLIAGSSFTNNSVQYNEAVARYYDDGLDSLLVQLKLFKKAAVQKKGTPAMKNHFFLCRNQYKKVSFFIEQFDTRGARLLNGPDLLRIEDDTQNDTTFPHGFQHIEAILFEAGFSQQELQQEIGIQIDNVEKLRYAPDHQFYFRNDKVWEALRSGTYRIISMGITGFDVPLSLHALPETKVQLSAIRKIIILYKDNIENKDSALYNDAIRACDKAILAIPAGAAFNRFDRLSFIKNQLNPLSECLARIAVALGYVNVAQRSPLNPMAGHLFAADIFNIDFFSPNERYRMTPERIALGKALFYDTKLSVNNSRSCASCHKPELAFTDGLAKGKHIDGKSSLLRNTPTLLNSVFQTRQFYDSRALVLETQLDAVVHSKEEMGGSLQEAIPVLAKNEQYNTAFAVAYKNDKEPISQYTIANAIASYIRTLVSFNSRFDRYVRGLSSDYTAAEKNGFNLFMGKGKCGTCHYAPMFNGLVPPLYEETESEILGVPADKSAKPKLDEDQGKFLYTKVPLHQYAFKTPTVRNIALTAPYMHNGVFTTLEEVVDFYDQGGGAGRGIHLDTQTLPSDSLHLSTTEKKELIVFLRSLNEVQ